jgi:predicted dehydrogenase
MSSTEKLGFALVGCGRIAQKHAEILGNGMVADARLVAVCDRIASRAKTMADRYKVPAYVDFHDMMSKEKNIDVVCLLTESGLHAKQTMELAQYGRHIVVEKPMALRLDDADAMIRTCEAHGIRLFVVKQNRYNLPVQKLREALDAGRFGRIVMGTVRVRWCRTQDYYDQDAWRGTWAMDGGVFANQASHHIDLLEWMLGQPASVYATSRTALVNIEAEDTGVAVIRFASGAIGVVEATTATRPKDLEGSISILGEFGSVEIGGFAVNEMKVWNFANPTADDAAILERFRENPPNVYGFGHVRYLEHVVDVIKNGAPALVDGAEGRRSLELISAIYESIESAREVPLLFRTQRAKLGMA